MSDPRSDDLDVARSRLAADLRSSAGFDADTASGVVEALFSGAMDPRDVVEGLLGGDAAGATAVSRFVSALEDADRRNGGGSSADQSRDQREHQQAHATTYQPPSLSAEASAARAAEEARRSAAAAVAAVSTGALAPPSAPGERTGRALAFKEAKKSKASVAPDPGGGAGAGGAGAGGSPGKRVLGEIARPADRRHANCLRCGRVYDTRSDGTDTRRLLQTGRCVFGPCAGSRVALRGGEVSDVRPPAPSPSTSRRSPPSSSSSVWVEDIARNPWLSSSERSAAIASVLELGSASNDGAPRTSTEDDEGAVATPRPPPRPPGPAPGLESRPMSFVERPSSRLWRRGASGYREGGGGREGGDRGEQQPRFIPGWHGDVEEERGGKRKAKEKSVGV